MNTPFWSKQPQILWDSQYLLEVWPLPDMNFEAKLNAISRLVIYISCIGYLFTFEFMYLFSGLLTLLFIFLIYSFRNTPFIKNSLEGFLSNGNSHKNKDNNKDKNKAIVTGNGEQESIKEFMKDDFYHSDWKNPFGNVLLTEINGDPHRKAAPPAFNPDVYVDIDSSSKGMVQNLNKGIKNTNKQLFGDLWDKFTLDQCLRNFYSMPNSKVPNDQGAYADYLYGDMPSCKDGNAFACVKDNLRYILI